MTSAKRGAASRQPAGQDPAVADATIPSGTADGLPFPGSGPGINDGAAALLAVSELPRPEEGAGRRGS